MADYSPWFSQAHRFHDSDGSPTVMYFQSREEVVRAGNEVTQRTRAEKETQVRARDSLFYNLEDEKTLFSELPNQIPYATSDGADSDESSYPRPKPVNRGPEFYSDLWKDSLGKVVESIYPRQKPVNRRHEFDSPGLWNFIWGELFKFDQKFEAASESITGNAAREKEERPMFYFHPPEGGAGGGGRRDGGGSAKKAEPQGGIKEEPAKKAKPQGGKTTESAKNAATEKEERRDGKRKGSPGIKVWIQEKFPSRNPKHSSRVAPGDTHNNPQGTANQTAGSKPITLNPDPFGHMYFAKNCKYALVCGIFTEFNPSGVWVIEDMYIDSDESDESD